MTSSDNTRMIVVGSANMDIGVRVPSLPLPGETIVGRDLSESPGGKGANAAVAAALLGGDVSFVGAVGDDQAGEALRRSLTRAGVDSTALQSYPGVTGTALIELDDDGENRIVVVPGANDLIAIDESARGVLDSSAAVLLSLEIPIEAVVDAARVAARSGARVVLNLSPFRAVPDELLRIVDVLIVNEHEAASLFDVDQIRPESLADLAPMCATMGIRSLVVTFGDRGAAIMLDALSPSFQHIPSVTAHAIDTTGCGDAFAGAVTLWLARGASLGDAVHAGNAVGGYAAEGRGAQSSYPTDAELRRWKSSKAISTAS